MDLLKGLNNMQSLAVTTTEGPLLILAGAGSGKTRTIIHRIAYILNEGLARPYEILALTFTNKAAQEMKTRIESFGIDYIGDMWMGTFHSICVRILRRYAEYVGFERSFTIYDDKDSEKIIKDCLAEMNISEKVISPKLAASVISRAKNDYTTPEEFELDNQETITGRHLSKVYKLYSEKLRKANAMDFDDLLFHTVTLLRTSDEALLYYQRRFKYVLVDEYQDTNPLQYEMTALIASGWGNLCVCGDDDQSIYSWRGADIQNILNFEEDFPNAQVIRLEQNYRSTSTILNAANEVIANNKGRKGKNLWTENETGEKIKIIATNRDLEEAEVIAAEILALKNSGISEDDIAVLYRMNSQSRNIEEGLSRKGINYKLVGSMSFYSRLEIKDIMAYLRLALNPKDTVAFARAITKPKRGVGNVAMEKLSEYAEFKGYSLVEASLDAANIPGIRAAVKESLIEFGKLVSDIKILSDGKAPLPEIIKKAIYESGYMKMLKEENKEDSEGRIDNLGELLNAAEDFYKLSDDTTLEGYLEYVSLRDELESKEDEGVRNPRVSLMTLHHAKGLEFNYVFIAGMENGIFPLTRAQSEQSEMEEERRLCYVGMTRAKKRLYMTYAKTRRVYNEFRNQEPSVYLEEIPEKYVNFVNLVKDERVVPNRPQRDYTSGGRMYSVKKEYTEPVRPVKNTVRTSSGQFSPGDKVEHPAFGIGTVVSSSGQGSDIIVTIAFAGVGIKKIMPSGVELKKL